MSKVFISFKSEDEWQVWSLRNLSEFKNVSFEMDDVSLRKAVNSDDKPYIRSVIAPKIRGCQVCLCLVGENTWRSRIWVPWEIELALEEGKKVIAMRFKSTPTAITPSVLRQNNIVPFDWDLERLHRSIGY